MVFRMKKLPKSLSTMDATSVTVGIIEMVIAFAHSFECSGAFGALEPHILSKIEWTEECIVDLVRISIVLLSNMTV